ncbi:hypothetical protein LJC60_02105 [Ruminococcaceae bacterium OttesenSCG-928-D13]|nr:hypothetical protein [Ruminococcaceae bacterium OttesenSCG-928-D13]
MDTKTLTESLRSLDVASLTWKFALYGTRKSRDGLELEWNLCNMRGINAQVEASREYLLKKPVADKPVAAYTPFLSDKENIGAVEKNDEMIREQVADILLNIEKGQAYPPEDFLSGVLPKTVGYAFYGDRKDESGQVQEQVLFMRRGNPFLSGTAARLFTGNGDEIAPSNKPILKFTTAVDFLLVGNVGYFLSSSIEKDFALENRHFAIAEKCMGNIADASIVSDYERLEQTVMTAKNARKFIDFDKRILEHITRLPIVERQDFLSTYGVTIDHEGCMDTFDPEQCELIIDLLCGRSCLDALGRLSVGSNITPRE